MIKQLIEGCDDYYIVEGKNGKEFDEELWRLNKILKPLNRKKEEVIRTKAIVVTKVRESK